MQVELSPTLIKLIFMHTAYSSIVQYATKEEYIQLYDQAVDYTTLLEKESTCVEKETLPALENLVLPFSIALCILTICVDI